MTASPLPAPPRDLLRDAALFLDFDGTLVDLAPAPEDVRVDARLAALVARLSARMPQRVAIISGRPAEAILALFEAPGFAVSGSHGLEIHWPDGNREQPERPAALDRIVADMKLFAAQHPGVRVETKPLGAALHYRTCPEHEAASHALARHLAAETGLHLQTGKMMVEVRLPGADKGTALRALMQAPAMAGRRPIFLGDDDTDEPAMAAAAALGGAGILVGEARPTAAAYRLPDVAATLAWLEAAAKSAA